MRRLFLWILIGIGLSACVAIKDTKYRRTDTQINLSRKGLTEIPDEVFENTDVRVLRLYGNNIDSIPERIGELVNLERLYLGKNDIKSLPKSIGN